MEYRRHHHRHSLPPAAAAGGAAGFDGESGVGDYCCHAVSLPPPICRMNPRQQSVSSALLLRAGVGIWLAMMALGTSILWRVGTVALSFIAVHLVWECFVFNPYVYLGARPVSDDDPVMQRAGEKALATLPVFLSEIFPRTILRTRWGVKYRFKTSLWVFENLWADLLEIDGDRLKIYVRTPPEHTMMDRWIGTR